MRTILFIPRVSVIGFLLLCTQALGPPFSCAPRGTGCKLPVQGSDLPCYQDGGFCERHEACCLSPDSLSDKSQPAEISADHRQEKDLADAAEVGPVPDVNDSVVDLAESEDLSAVACTESNCVSDAPSTIACCLGGACVLEPLDCDDGNDCTDDTLGPTGCFHAVSAKPGCCQFRYDCEDASELTWEVCDNFHCVVRISPLVGCHTDVECYNGNVCDVPECGPDGWCVYTPRPLAEQLSYGLECCLTDGDCSAGGIFEEDSDGDGLPGPDDPATLDVCASDHCEHLEGDAECECGVDRPPCPEPTNGYFQASCVGGCVCASFPKPFPACAVDGQCQAANSFGAKCLGNTCVVSLSAITLVHCMDELLVDCSDDNYCTVDGCFFLECHHTPWVGEGCCLVDGDCWDSASCSHGKCVDNQCL